MIVLSDKLNKYFDTAGNLPAALDEAGEEYRFIAVAKDIWMRDYMPVKTKSGKYVSFRYEPSYHRTEEEKAARTVFARDVQPVLKFENVIYSDINLDGGNVVFSPSKGKAIISDRVFSENSEREPYKFLKELERLLECDVFIIESLKSDMTGHADGMVRFANENTVIINDTPYRNGLEQRQEKVLRAAGFDVLKMPYYHTKGISAEGCYLNYLETERHVFLPVFDNPLDLTATRKAGEYLCKKVIPVPIPDVAKQGGGLNCISFES